MNVIGLYDGHRFQKFIRGKNLEAFPRAAKKFPLLVSFNGAQFDMRFLRAAFPGFDPAAHVDLRFPLERLGYSGGLKAVERAFRIRRPKGVREIDGFEAIRLWRRYEAGDRRALDRLVEYTRHDVVNLVPLAKGMLRGMRRKIGVDGDESEGQRVAPQLGRLQPGEANSARFGPHGRSLSDRLAPGLNTSGEDETMSASP